MIPLLSVIFILFTARVKAECANACNGHGKCTSYDMCICNRNWQASDCSERVCQFGLAHVDTPKGDLDMSGTITGPDHIVADNSFNYPYGTTEQYPQTLDTDLNELVDSAHYYMECSNKGTCDRTAGACTCYEGYEGVACQRALCPNSCSGHGVCKSKAQLAKADHDNVYRLWDKYVGMGCLCDPGYGAADCSEKQCKYGVDPLYLDDSATIKYSVYDFATLTNPSATVSTALFHDGTPAKNQGYWAIRFYDIHGEDWLTQPIKAGASCHEVLAALESLPNNVIPHGTTYCILTSSTKALPERAWSNFVSGSDKNINGAGPGTKHPYFIHYNMSIWEASTPLNVGGYGPGILYAPVANFASSHDGSSQTLEGYIYRLQFYGVPGAIKQPEIEIYLDGKRPSLVSDNKVITKVWTDGQQGETNDYFADHCDHVTVTIKQVPVDKSLTGASYLSGLTLAEKKLLKSCLGSADLDNTNNVGVYNWDLGSKLYPHIVKLVRTVTVYTDGGIYAALYYDTSVDDGTGDPDKGSFKLLNPFYPADMLATDQYEVYTTKGTLALTSDHSQAYFSFGSNSVFTANVTYDLNNNVRALGYDGDISCEVGNTNTGKFAYINHCLNKTDLFTLLNFETPHVNPPRINLYTATRLKKLPALVTTEGTTYLSRFPTFGTNPSTENDPLHFLTNVISTDLSTNWGTSLNIDGAVFHVYKFFPSTASTYEVVAECSNRGLCARDTGLCGCFAGYTSDDCSIQDSIAL